MAPQTPADTISSAMAPPPTRGVTRRQAVVLCVLSAGAGAAATAVLPGLAAPRPKVHPWAQFAPALLPMDTAGLPAVGKLCESALAQRNQALDGSSELAGFEWTNAGVSTPKGLPVVRKTFEDHIAAEFGEGRVVIVDRWVLSETQAALCALAARAGAAGES